MSGRKGSDPRNLRFRSGEMRSGRGGEVPEDGCQRTGTVPRGGHYPGRERPSFFIFHCNVERFIPNRAAAPFGPPSTHFVSCSPEDVLPLGLGQRHRRGGRRRE